MQRPDPIEKFMDCRVEDMTGAEMAAYLKLCLSTRYNIDLPQHGIIERKTFEAFKRRYPDGKAGQILQWVMMHHKGRKDGEYVSSSMFSQAFKWWTDKMYMEMQAAEQRKNDAQPGTEELKAAFLNAESMA